MSFDASSAAPETAAFPQVRFRLIQNPGVDAAEAAWRDLESRSEASFFLSWTWIGVWLRSVTPGWRIWLLEGHADGRLVALGVLVGDDSQPTRLCLHETGQEDIDALTIERNGLLIARGYDPASVASAALRSVFAALPSLAELRMGGVERPYVDAVSPAGLLAQALDRKPSFVVDLGAPFADGLSASSRWRLRRALRLYGAAGKVEIRRAPRLDVAYAWFSEMKRLHQDRWRAKGKADAFANPPFEPFHRALIAEGLPSGAVDMLRVTAGGSAIGYLYNFRKGGRVYAYQSGFDYPNDPRLKPGVVAHALACDLARAEGASRYDHLAGENPMKKSYARRDADLWWIVAIRPTLRRRVGGALRKLAASAN